MATFRRNGKGEWVVFGRVSEVKPGRVSVEKKGGAVACVTVESVGKPFNVRGELMVYGYIAKRAPRAEAAPAAPSFEEAAAEAEVAEVEGGYF